MKSVYDAIRVLLRHRRIDGKRKRTLKPSFRHRKLTAAITESLLIKGMKVQRNKMDRRSDTSLLQLLDHRIAANPKGGRIHLNDVEVPCVRHMAGRDGALKSIKGRERGTVSRGDGIATRLHRLALRKLCKPQRRLNIGHVVFVADTQNVVSPG